MPKAVTHHSLSIKQKLRLIIMATVGVALALACLAVVGYDYWAFRASMRNSTFICSRTRASENCFPTDKSVVNHHGPRTLPMVRGACDGIVPCPWQPVCYHEGVTDPATLPLYERRECGMSMAAGGRAR